MSIYISKHLQDFGKYQLNDSRIEKILQAKNLDEATKMGLWDRIKDYFRDNAKQETIRDLFEKVTSPDNIYESHPLRMSHRFPKLRLLAKEECQSEFRLDIKTSPDDIRQWDYHLRAYPKRNCRIMSHSNF